MQEKKQQYWHIYNCAKLQQGQQRKPPKFFNNSPHLAAQCSSVHVTILASQTLEKGTCQKIRICSKALFHKRFQSFCKQFVKQQNCHNYVVSFFTRIALVVCCFQTCCLSTIYPYLLQQVVQEILERQGKVKTFPFFHEDPDPDGRRAIEESP